MASPAEAVSILHVDDDQGFLGLASRALDQTDERLDVTSALSATERLARLDDDWDLDCVVSDYEMPGMDGLDLLVAVRSEFPDLHFVLFTGKGTEEIARHGGRDRRPPEGHRARPVRGARESARHVRRAGPRAVASRPPRAGAGVLEGAFARGGPGRPGPARQHRERHLP